MSESATIPNLSTAVNRVRKKNVKMLNTAENEDANQNIQLPAPEKAGNREVARHLARRVIPVTGRSTVVVEKEPGAMMKTYEK